MLFLFRTIIKKDLGKYIICPYCKKRIEFSVIRKFVDKNNHVKMNCVGCKRELAFTLSLSKEASSTKRDFNKNKSCQENDPLAILHVVENIFGFSADFPLYEGLNRVGRYNDKHTDIEVAVRTADPSMDRNHTLITIEQTKNGVLAVVMDDDSMTGTFINARELTPGEKYQLKDGDVITLGATSIIFSKK